MSSQPNNLRINQEEKRFLGVCAGIADYLDMPVVLVRIIFVISILTWPTLSIAYFALYFWLDRDLSTEKVSDWFNGNAPTQHLKNLDYRRPLYRNMRNHRIAGVCAGIADYLEIKVCWVRFAAIAAAFILGPYALLAYGVCWFVMEPNPAPQLHKNRERYKRRKGRKYRHGKHRHHHMSSSRINSAEDDDLDSVIDEAYDEAMSGFDDLYEDAKSDELYKTDSGSVTIELDLKRKKATAKSRQSYNEKSMEECADTYYSLENRLRELEAFITSKKFRLQCEINRI